MMYLRDLCSHIFFVVLAPLVELDALQKTNIREGTRISLACFGKDAVRSDTNSIFFPSDSQAYCPRSSTCSTDRTSAVVTSSSRPLRKKRHIKSY